MDLLTHMGSFLHIIKLMQIFLNKSVINIVYRVSPPSTKTTKQSRILLSVVISSLASPSHFKASKPGTDSTTTLYSHLVLIFVQVIQEILILWSR